MNKKIATGIFMICFPLVILLLLPILIVEREISFSKTVAISSELLPRIVLATMILCGVGITVEGVKDRRAKRKEEAIKICWKPIIAMSIVSLAYACLMPFIGYFVSTVIALFISIWIFNNFSLDKKKCLMALAVSCTTSVLIYIVFAILLRVPVPSGLLF